MAKETIETVTLRLQQQVTGPAAQVQGALAQLEARVVSEQEALGKLEASLVSAKQALTALATGGGKGVVDIEAYRAQKAAVQALSSETAGQKAVVSSLIGTVKKLRPAHEEAKKGSDSARKSLQELALASRVLGGEAGYTTSRVAMLGASILGLSAETAGVALVLIAATASLAGFVAMVVYAISSADEYRNKILDLTSAGVTLWNSQRASIAAATALNDQITAVSANSAIARDKISGFAEAIKNSMFLGRQLFTNAEVSKVLSTMSMVAAGGNDRLAKQYLESARASRLYGLSLDKLNERMRLKFGAVAEARLLSLDVQLRKLGENIKYIFSGTDVEPLLKGLQSILRLFNLDSEGAITLRESVTKMTEFVIGGILRVAIALVKSYIWLREHEKIWRTIKAVGTAAAVGIGASVLIVAGVVAALVALIGGAILVTVAFWGAVVLGAQKAYEWIQKVTSGFSFPDLFASGVDMIKGFAAGIRSKGSEVVDAIVNAAKSAVDAAKKFLGIHSPSKLMDISVGRPTAQGQAIGIRKGIPEIEAAAMAASSAAVYTIPANDVAPAKAPSFIPPPIARPAPSLSPAQAPRAESPGAGRSVEFNNCVFGSVTQEQIEKWVRGALEAEALDGAAA